ncbi:hypothetical protein [Agrobacterium sp. 22-226-1]
MNIHRVTPAVAINPEFIQLGASGNGNSRAERNSPKSRLNLEARFLRRSDVDALLALEATKWTDVQAATRADLERRIAHYPDLSIGAFSIETGEALASLFLKPITAAEIRAARTWADCTTVFGPTGAGVRSLFGISLSSSSAPAVREIFTFFWPYALKQGWRQIYLGSPMPGLASWRRANPGAPIDDYVGSKRDGLPRDPQLRYYYKKGFRRIEGWRAEYFPHEASLDHAAILCGDIPLSFASPLWTRVPLSWLRRMGNLALRTA